jgi:hypothetical protein
MRSRESRGRRLLCVTSVVTCVAACVVAPSFAAEVDAPSPYVHAADATTRPAKNAFSLAFAVRPWAPPNLVRIDSAVLVDKTQTNHVPTLTAGVKVVGDLGVYFRGAFVSNAPNDRPRRSGIANPAIFGLYAPEIAPRTRLPLFLAFAVPLGEGGGDAPDADPRAALGTGIYARQAMDNALFAPNYFTTAVGAGVARVDRGWTFQLEAAIFQLFRTRGAAMDAERTRTNLTSGINLGYAVTEFLNLNVETHYQRWLSTPAVVQKDAAFRDQLTIGGGVRFTVAMHGGVVIRPGVGYFRGLDAPMARNSSHIVQLDVPIVFL